MHTFLFRSVFFCVVLCLRFALDRTHPPVASASRPFTYPLPSPELSCWGYSAAPFPAPGWHQAASGGGGGEGGDGDGADGEGTEAKGADGVATVFKKNEPSPNAKKVE